MYKRYISFLFLHSKLPQTQCLNTRQLFSPSFSLLGVHTLISRPSAWGLADGNQGACQAWVLHVVQGPCPVSFGRTSFLAVEDLGPRCPFLACCLARACSSFPEAALRISTDCLILPVSLVSGRFQLTWRDQDHPESLPLD